MDNGVREQTLVTPHMAYDGNTAIVPTTPGLDIALDHQALQPYIKQEFVVEP